MTWSRSGFGPARETGLRAGLYVPLKVEQGFLWDLDETLVRTV
jgi:hypothetical protein